MRKIIVIGECTLDLIFPENSDCDSLDVEAAPGGRLLNAAAMLGKEGRNVCYVSECGRDRCGDMLVSFLERNGVKTDSVDRFSDGITPLNLRFMPEDEILCSRTYPKERFDVVWPRIDQDDIVVFGTYFSLDPRVRPQLLELLQHAIERKAIVIYVPGLTPEPKTGITKLMPDILENLEMASVVLTRSNDISLIFNETESERAYERHIRFYCNSYINVDFKGETLELYHRDVKCRKKSTGLSDILKTNAGVIAGTVAAIDDCGLLKENMQAIDAASIEKISGIIGSYSMKTNSIG